MREKRREKKKKSGANGLLIRSVIVIEIEKIDFDLNSPNGSHASSAFGVSNASSASIISYTS
ncbi:hypothetical protein E4U46_002722 [Claviceps purpurea]|nr:hypothetical protein E4U46_002722 [Claviceps purpurea]